MRASLKLGRIAGIEVGVHYTWFFAFFLITWSLASGLFLRQYPGWGPATYWITAAAASLLLFTSVLVHELAHSLFARARGLPAHSITLFIFGGVSNLGAEAERPRDEFVVAVVGPLASLLVAGVSWLLLWSAGSLGQPVAATFRYLALINVMLAVFNLLPGFPLDGGRVLRSLLWAKTKSFSRATRIAARVGQVFGWLLIGVGLLLALSGSLLSGVWMALIGWFLSSAADASRRELTSRGRFRGVRVDQVMDPAMVTVPPDTVVRELVMDYFLRQGRRALPVSRDGVLEGIVSVTDARGVSQDRWDHVLVGDIMTRDPLYVVGPDDDLSVALDLLAARRLNQLPVLQGNRVVGLLTRADVIHYLQFSQEFGLGPDSRGRGQQD